VAKDPKRWNEVIIDSPLAKLTKRDVFDYYQRKDIKNKILNAIKASDSRETILRQSFSPSHNVLRRKDHQGKLIDLSSRPAFDQWAGMRMSEVHPVFGHTTSNLLVDIDPGKSVSWKKVKEMADTVAKTMDSSDDVKNVTVQFSGDRGFYVRGALGQSMGINKAREKVKSLMSGLSQREDTVMKKPEANQIRLDTSPMKNRGSVKAPYSLSAITGLVAAPVELKDLLKVEKKDFLIGKVKTAALATRPRVELFARKDGKILSGLFPQQGVGVYGGGVDPGEDPLGAAQREFLEEAGYNVKNVAPIDVAPFRQRWLKAHNSPKQLARKKEFPGGTLTHAFVGDIVGNKQGLGEDHSSWLKDVGFRSVDELLEIQRGVLGSGTPAEKRLRNYRLQVLEALRGMQEKSASTIRNMKQDDISKFKLKRVSLKKPWEHKIVIDKGDIKGFAAYSPEEKELKQLWVSPGARRSGTATRLIASFSGPVNRALVNKSNKAAQKLYASLGMVDSAKRVGPGSKIEMIKSAEFAPGIPKARKIDAIPNIENQSWMLSIQKHIAQKAGKHYDLRLVDPETDKAHSFAIPKARLPRRSDRMLLAVQQPTHTSDYALNFTGTIPDDTYGAGTVTMPFKEKIEVVKSNADKIRFQRDNGQRYVLFRTKADTPAWGFKRLK